MERVENVMFQTHTVKGGGWWEISVLSRVLGRGKALIRKPHLCLCSARASGLSAPVSISV